MKLFSLFTDKASKPTDHSVKSRRPSDAKTETNVNSDSKSRSTQSKRRDSKRSSGNSKHVQRLSSTDSAPIDDKTRDANAMRTAEKLMTVMNDYDPQNPQAYIDAFCDLFQKGKKGKILAEDGDCHSAEQCATLLTLLHDACPNDYAMLHTNIVQQDKDHFTVVGVSPSGTHTGSALTIMPGVLPAVPPSGKHVSLDEENYRCRMNRDGTKIKQVEVVAMGNLTGFAGFYEGCGGSLVPPS